MTLTVHEKSACPVSWALRLPQTSALTERPSSCQAQKKVATEEAEKQKKEEIKALQGQLAALREMQAEVQVGRVTWGPGAGGQGHLRPGVHVHMAPPWALG